MRFQDYLIEKYFEYLKLSEDRFYFTNLLNLAYALVEAEPKKNTALVKQLNFIRDNTTSVLMLPMAKAEELYAKYRVTDIKASGAFKVDYMTVGGMPKTISIGGLKYHLSQAIFEVTKHFSKLGKHYNIQRKRDDDDE